MSINGNGDSGNGSKRPRRALPALDWKDPHSAADWFNGLSTHVEDLLDLADDATRPVSLRRLGRVLHREELAELRGVLTRALDSARRGLEQ